MEKDQWLAARLREVIEVIRTKKYHFDEKNEAILFWIDNPDLKPQHYYQTLKIMLNKYALESGLRECDLHVFGKYYRTISININYELFR